MPAPELLSTILGSLDGREEFASEAVPLGDLLQFDQSEEIVGDRETINNGSTDRHAIVEEVKAGILNGRVDSVDTANVRNDVNGCCKPWLGHEAEYFA